jgi:creatinine amidohydrolase
MQLSLSTWPEVEAYLRGSRGVVIPIGSTEQHGPNGLIGTDAICPEVVARGVGEAADAMVAPTISVGIAQHHLGFTGSMCLRPSTLIALMRDYVLSLAKHGFDRFFFLNGHGGNIATVQAAFAEIYSEVSLETWQAKRPIRCTLRNWWDGEGVDKLSEELYGEDEGQHATCSEVSLTQYAYPDSIKNVNFEARAPAYSGIHDADDYRRRYPDGRIGSLPSLSTPEHGRRFYETSVKEVAEAYKKSLEDN